MSPSIAAIAYSCVILGLFWLDRNAKERTSWALWIPIVWLALSASRSVSQWMALGEPLELTDGTDFYIEGNPTDRWVYTGILAAALIVILLRRRRVWGFLRANAPIMIFFGLCLVSLAWSEFPEVAFKRWTKATGDWMMVLIVLTDPRPLAAIKRFFARTSFLLIPLSVLFVKYYPEYGKQYGRWDYKASYTGVTTNKNTLGVICLLFGLASLWRLVTAYRQPPSTQRTKELIAHGVLLAMVLWLFWIVNSMTSLACFLLACGLLLAANMKWTIRRPATVHVLIASVVLLSASVLFLGLGPGLLTSIGRDPTLTDRTAIWGLVVSLVKHPLIGTGFESFWLGPRLSAIWAVYSWQPGEAHNGYLEIYLNLGWIGICLLGVVLVTGYRNVIAAYRRDPMTGSLLVAFFAAGMVYNFTEAAFFRMMAPAWIMLLLTMTRALPLRRAEAVVKSRGKTVPALQYDPHPSLTRGAF